MSQQKSRGSGGKKIQIFGTAYPVEVSRDGGGRAATSPFAPLLVFAGRGDRRVERHLLHGKGFAELAGVFLQVLQGKIKKG